ncbi:RNA polymerase sigma factor [Sphingobacterium sp. SYP-B4668]|uniref:RNA polymerase sigma factor n=1 Tax=Sphingobacterium sp. SYP-B4668 TaxID=2996035 RepID=UPI0022DE69F7|nr:sigma-70 family RNA polymerase sigma factor [Sphingobacterium sp. SYP-B4668]
MGSNLIEGFANGNEGALTDIFYRLNPTLIHFAIKYLKDEDAAEEIVSDSFVKAWGLRTQFTTLENLRAFLYVTTKNACLNQLRKVVHERMTDDFQEYEALILQDQDTLTKIIRTELVQQLYEEVENLPPLQKEIFKFSFFEELDPQEISVFLQIPISSVYMNKSRAIKALKNKLSLDHTTWGLLMLLLFK